MISNKYMSKNIFKEQMNSLQTHGNKIREFCADFIGLRSTKQKLCELSEVQRNSEWRAEGQQHQKDFKSFNYLLAQTECLGCLLVFISLTRCLRGIPENRTLFLHI